MSNSKDVIEMACLGRPFRLGMLYDCRSDHLIPGMTLWNDKTLRSALDSTPQVGSDFEVIAEDSLEEKASQLNISGNLKLSFFGGLVEVSGSAKYLDDRKTSKQQSRVSLKYRSTSRFDQLTMDQLGTVEYPDVYSKKIATHVVVGVLYGADAFFVFDQKVGENEKVCNVQGQVEALIKCLPGMSSIKGEVGIKMNENDKQTASKLQCKFHGDLQLQQNPTTFEDAVHVFQQLPELTKGQNVPKKVWLYPLSNMNSEAAKLVHDISVNLVSQAQQVMEELLDYDMQCNDLIKNQVCSVFPALQSQLSKFKGMLLQYKTEFSKQLCQLLPAIREGGKEECQLADVFKSKESSPFSSHSLTQWLQQKHIEISILATQLKSFQNVSCIELLPLASDLEGIVHDNCVEYVLCLSFQMLKGDDPLLEGMQTFLSTHKSSLLKKEAESWSKDQSVMAGMRKHVSEFTKFAQVNEKCKGVKFVVAGPSSECVDGTTAILLYKNGEAKVFDPPSCPDDIQCVKTTQSTISLEWARPQQGSDSVHHYTVDYCKEKDVSLGQWKAKTTKGHEAWIEVGDLQPVTPYCFKVRAECEPGVSEFSKVSSPISTRISDRLAEVMKAVSLQLPNDDGPPTYKVCGEETALPGKKLHKVAIGEASVGVPEKVLMVLGATGAGKSTLINGMINYIFGVQWKDNFRFKLITEVAKSQAHSQTSAITAYTIYKMDGSKVDYNLTIIDTPGFGDTSGLERDKDITQQIKEFFSVKGRNGVSHLNGIGFVSQSALARLTPTQRYIFDSILSIFGKDVAENIFIMVTFADGQKPPVMSAIEEAHIPHKGFFKFNNSALFAETCEGDDEDNFDEMFWKMGVSSFKKFFTAFQKADDVSLTMTKDVLHLRQHLETIVIGLQVQMKECLAKMEELRQERIILKDHEKDISTNKDFTYEITVPCYRREKLQKDVFVTNCLRCSISCHYPCGIADNDNKRWCSAMGFFSPKCTVCPGACHWSDHKNTGERIILEQRQETRTSEDLKKKFETAKQGKAAHEEMLAGHQRQLEEAHAQLHELVEESQKCLERLDQIALKPNPLTQVEYIELLINSEKQQAKEGWMERVRYLETTKQQAELLAVMKDANDADERIKQEEMIKKEGWEQRVETLKKVKRIKVEVENIKQERVEKRIGVWGTINKAAESTIQAAGSTIKAAGNTIKAAGKAVLRL